MSNQVYRNQFERYGGDDAYYRKDADQSVNDGITPVVIDFEIAEKENIVGLSEAAGVFTVSKPKSLAFTAQVAVQSDVNGRRYIAIVKNGDVNGAVFNMREPISAGTTYLSICQTVRMVPGDTVDVRFFQDSGIALNVLGKTSSSTRYTSLKITEIK